MRFKTAREQRRKCSGTGSDRSGQSSNRRIAREKGEERRAVGGGCVERWLSSMFKGNTKKGGFALI